jgi:hypothetical protein
VSHLIVKGDKRSNDIPFLEGGPKIFMEHNFILSRVRWSAPSTSILFSRAIERAVASHAKHAMQWLLGCADPAVGEDEDLPLSV